MIISVIYLHSLVLLLSFFCSSTLVPSLSLSVCLSFSSLFYIILLEAFKIAYKVILIIIYLSFMWTVYLHILFPLWFSRRVITLKISLTRPREPRNRFRYYIEIYSCWHFACIIQKVELMSRADGILPSLTEVTYILIVIYIYTLHKNPPFISFRF